MIKPTDTKFTKTQRDIAFAHIIVLHHFEPVARIRNVKLMSSKSIVCIKIFRKTGFASFYTTISPKNHRRAARGEKITQDLVINLINR